MTPFAELLFAALDAEYGVIVEHSDRRYAHTMFAKERRKNPLFKRISFTMPEEQPHWLMLVKCPDEKQNLLTVIMSTSTSPTSSGSEPPTAKASESTEPSE